MNKVKLAIKLIKYVPIIIKYAPQAIKVGKKIALVIKEKKPNIKKIKFKRKSPKSRFVNK